ncbi:hypothetical protein MC885_009585, partial [Smutsia gigantea]
GAVPPTSQGLRQNQGQLPNKSLRAVGGEAGRAGTFPVGAQDSLISGRHNHSFCVQDPTTQTDPQDGVKLRLASREPQ